MKRCPSCGTLISCLALSFIFWLNLSVSPGVSEAAEAPEPGLAAQTSAGGKWRGGESERSAFDDSPTIIFTLQAEAEFQGWLERHRAALLVRCRENRTEVFINTGTAASVESGNLDRHAVRIRFDQNEAFTQRWSESSNNEALFASSHIPLARQIAQADRMLFQFTPFNANPAVIEFDVRGFDRHIELVAETCNWSVDPPPRSTTSQSTIDEPSAVPATVDLNTLVGMSRSELQEKFGPPRGTMGPGAYPVTYWTDREDAIDGRIHLSFRGRVVDRVRVGLGATATYYPETVPAPEPEPTTDDGGYTPVGLTEAQVRERLGEPTGEYPRMWLYEMPSGTVRVYFEDGEVSRVLPEDFLLRAPE